MARWTCFEDFEETSGVFVRRCHLIELIRCAVMEGEDSLTFNAVLSVKKTGNTLDVACVFFQFFVTVAFDCPSEADAVFIEVEYIA